MAMLTILVCTSLALLGTGVWRVESSDGDDASTLNPTGVFGAEALIVTKTALLSMARTDDDVKLRRLLVTRNPSAIANGRLCLRYFPNGSCEWTDIFMFQNSSIFTVSASQKGDNQAVFPLCGVGYGQSLCGGPAYLTSPCGVIKSQRTGPKGEFLGCQWFIDVGEGSGIELDFAEFDFKDYAGGPCDRLNLLILLPDSEGRTVSTIRTLCGRMEQWKYISHSHRLSISLEADRNTAFSFNIPYTAIPNSERVVQQHRELTFDSVKSAISHRENIPVFPEQLAGEISWHIRAPVGKYISVEWELHMANNSYCQECSIKMFDGPTAHTDLKANQTIQPQTNNLKGKGTSSGFHLLVVFKGRPLTQGITLILKANNYEATVTNIGARCIQDPSSKNDGGSGSSSVMISGIADSNSSYSQCVWSLDARQGLFYEFRTTNMTFPGSNTDDCSREGFIIYDGNSTSSPAFGPFCDTVPDRLFLVLSRSKHITSSTSSLLVVFYSYPPRSLLNGRPPAELRAKLTTTACPGLTLSRIRSYNFQGLVVKEHPDYLNITLNMHSCFTLQHVPAKNPIADNYIVNVVNNNSGASIPLFYDHSIASGGNWWDLLCRSETSSMIRYGTAYHALFDPSRPVVLSSSIHINHSAKPCSSVVGGFVLQQWSGEAEIKRVQISSDTITYIRDFARSGRLELIADLNYASTELRLSAPLSLARTHYYSVRFTCRGRCGWNTGVSHFILNVRLFDRPYYVWEKAVPFTSYRTVALGLPHLHRSVNSAYVFINLYHDYNKRVVEGDKMIIQYELHEYQRPEGYHIPGNSASTDNSVSTGNNASPGNTASPGNNSSSCPEEGSLFHGSSCYKLYENPGRWSLSLTWNKAHELCTSLGGHLASITSREEWEVIRYTILTQWKHVFDGNYNIYIGLAFSETVSE